MKFWHSTEIISRSLVFKKSTQYKRTRNIFNEKENLTQYKQHKAAPWLFKKSTQYKLVPEIFSMKKKIWHSTNSIKLLLGYFKSWHSTNLYLKYFSMKKSTQYKQHSTKNVPPNGYLKKFRQSIHMLTLNCTMTKSNDLRLKVFGHCKNCTLQKLSRTNKNVKKPCILKIISLPWI